MEFRQLGRTGVRVTPLCLGAMNFGMPGSDESEGIATIHAALDGGLNFIDTANVYSRGASEDIVGQALEGRRDNVVLATKVHGSMSDDVNDHGNSRRHIKRQCEASLRRLRTDWIDLYQLHRPDATTPIEESLQALDDLITEGKVAYAGISTYPAWETMEALAVAERHHLASGPVSEQPPYNLLERRIEADVIPLAQKYGLAILPWSPLASGILTGKYSGGTIPADTRLARWEADPASERFSAALDTASRLEKLAADAGMSLIQLALAWLMAQPGVTAPIIGPRDRAQLADNLAALDVSVGEDLQAAIDEIVPPKEAVFRLF
jgi:aryl-alcohol dehydrogenase-like predicted oxidoreductase